MIVQNEERFEIFLDELRKPTNDLRVIYVGRYCNRAAHNIFVNVTVLLIASTSVMYLKKSRKRCRNFNGGLLGKTHLGD